MDLRTLLDSTPDGSTLRLPPGTYPLSGGIQRAVTIETGRLIAPDSRPEFGEATIIADNGGMIVTGPDVTIRRGIDIKCINPAATIVQSLGPRFTLEQSRILGSPTQGARRGLASNSVGGKVLCSVIDECWQKTSEAQAIDGWDNMRDWVIDNSYLGGGSQSLLLGGADAKSPSRIPTNIRLTRSDLAKNPVWASLGAVLKTSLETKCVAGFYSNACTFKGAGKGQGQGGYVMVFKSADQENSAPWSVSCDILIENFSASQAGSGIIFVGHDGGNPAEVMSNIHLRNGSVFEIDNQLYAGDGRMLYFQSGAIDINLENLTLQGRNLAASMYLIAPQPVRLQMHNIALPKATYGIKIDNFGMGLAALKRWAPDAIFDNVTEG